MVVPLIKTLSISNDPPVINPVVVIVDEPVSIVPNPEVIDPESNAPTVVAAVVTNDNGTMVQVALSDVKTYLTSAGFSTEDPTDLAIALG